MMQNESSASCCPTAGLLGNPHFHRDPYPTLAQLRASAPLHYIEENGRCFWLVTRFAEASQLLKDGRISMMNPNAEQTTALELPPMVQRMGGRMMLALDPPDHTRLRGLVSKAFTSRFIEELRPRIQRLTDELLDAIVPRGRMELVNDFAFPLPIVVIAEMLGVPPEDRERLRGWSELIFDAMTFVLKDDPVRDARAQEYIDYMEALIETKRREPRNDLISKLAQAEEAGSQLDARELLSMITLLIFAGHETTVNLISSGMLGLLTHPDELTKLQKEPTLIPSAIEEFLRMHGPVTVSNRFALEDIEISGYKIRKGDWIVVSFASADRDDQQFPDPDALDVTRGTPRHLAFGLGIHFCLGAQLARLEAQVAFTTLLRRLPGIRLDASPESLQWRANFILRGLRQLPVVF